MWLSSDDATDSLSRAGLELIAKPLTRCSFDNCPAVDVDHLDSTLPDLLSYPLYIGHSIAEGVIVRPACCRQPNKTRKWIYKKLGGSFLKGGQINTFARRVKMAGRREPPRCCEAVCAEADSLVEK